MQKKYFLLAPLAGLLLAVAPRLAQAQTGAVGIGTTAPDAAAALDIVSTAKGLLVPRLTATQRGAIAAPVPAGLLVYQTDGVQPGFWYYEATAGWTQLATGTGTSGDNLGNHTAIQNLNLGANLLTGTGGYTGSAVGIGVRADGGLDLGQNTAGNNLYVGFGAGRANTTPPGGYGTGNQYIGYQSGLRSTTGSRNDFSGYQSGYSNTTGSQNTFGGYLSGSNNTEGHSNTFYGFYSGGSNSTGIGNTFIGSQTGISNRTGSNNTVIGNNSGPQSGGFGGPPLVLNNATAVGANVALTTSNTLILGNNVNVGIGTSYPGQKLELRDGNVLLQSSGSAFVGIRSYTSILSSVDLGVAATDRSYSYLDHAGDAVLASNNSLLLAGRHGGSVVVGTGPNIEEERLRVTSDGNVGIGTSTPAQRLEVAGSVQISGTGSGLVFPDGTTQTTAASTAPAQTLALSGQDLSLSGGNTVTLPTQQLSISGSTISLTDGGSVTVPSDNLGNHTATTNIGLNGNWLSNAPGNANGIRVDNLGNVGVGVAPTATGLQVRTAEKTSVSNSSGVFLSGGASGNPNIELRGTNGSTFLDFVNGTTLDYDSRILSGGTGLGFYTGGIGTPVLLLAPSAGSTSGTATLNSLAGAGTRMVTADGTGTLGTQALPTADNLGNHTATRALNLASFPLVGNGGSTGLTIANSGAVTTAGALTATGNLSTGGTLTATGALTTASTLTAAGTTKLSALGNGSSTRMVTAAADGTLGATTLPTDAQQLSISGSTISLTNGGSVTVPATPGDNLGNHTATQNLNLGNKLLVGNGGTDGIVIDRNGLVGLNVPTPTYRLDVGGNLRVSTSAVIADNLSVGTTVANVPFTVQANGSGYLQSFQTSAGVSKYHLALRNGGLALAENGVGTNLFLQDGGNVGIGTENPGHPLTVSAGGASYAALLGFSTYNGVDKFNFSLSGGGLNLSESGVAGGRLFVKDGGNVGVGTITPVSRLSIGQVTSQSGTAGQNLGELSFVGFNRSNASASIQVLSKGFDDTGHLLFKTSPDGSAPAERLRVTADGNVGIGTGTPAQKLDVNGNATVSGSMGIGTSAPTQRLDVAGGILARGSGLVSTQGAYLQWNREGGDGATWLLNQNGTGGGGIRFGQSNAVSSGANAVAEWARFDGGGRLGLGTTTPDAKLDIESGDAQQLILTTTSTDPTGMLTLNFPATNSVSNTSTELVIFNKAGQGAIGQIVANLSGNSVSYATASDRRMKEHIGATHYGLADLLKLRVKDYNFIGTTQRTTGFLAQDLFRVYPDAVKEGDHGPTVTNAWAVDYGKLTPLLVQAIQDQQALIAQQQAEIQALKARTATAEVKAAAAETRATQATATLDTFEARLRRLEAGSAQAQR